LLSRHGSDAPDLPPDNTMATRGRIAIGAG